METVYVDCVGPFSIWRCRTLGKVWYEATRPGVREPSPEFSQPIDAYGWCEHQLEAMHTAEQMRRMIG